MTIATSLRRRAMRHGAIVAVLLVGILLAPLEAYAEFILDDFDDPAIAISPEMVDEFVVTEDVGPLNAKRSIRVVAFQGNPEGFLDANISAASTLTGQITHLNPVPSGAALVAVQSNYEFPPVDLTEGGRNNAFFFDFLLVTSELPPSLFKILLRDDHDNYAHLDLAFPLNDGPFTVIVPFDQFPPRGGGSTRPDYTTIDAMNMELRASVLSGGGPDPLNFLMRLDRIRVGRMVPEPRLLELFVGGLLALGGARMRSSN